MGALTLSCPMVIDTPKLDQFSTKCMTELFVKWSSFLAGLSPKFFFSRAIVAILTITITFALVIIAFASGMVFLVSFFGLHLTTRHN